MRRLFLASLAVLSAISSSTLAQPVAPLEADAVFSNYVFSTGESLPEVKLHFTTLGTPRRDARGDISNAVMILHGTGGTGHQFFQPQFAGALFGPGQVLDTSKYFIILPDNIGHGKSSKPSDGLRMAFPKYDYSDMIAMQHALVTKTLGIKKLKLILGTSMGCMHAFMWGSIHPEAVEKLAPFACLPVEIAGQNRMWRKLSIDAIKADPTWNGGNYTAPPMSGLRTAATLNLVAGANPLALQAQYPTRQAAEAFTDEAFDRVVTRNDANDIIYQLDSSRNYNPWPSLEAITAPTLWINSADDFINPANYGITEMAMKRLPNTKFILIPASPETKGHGTHTWAKFWKDELAAFLGQ